MVETLRKAVIATGWLVVVTMPLLTGFVVIFFSLQHRGLEFNLHPWLLIIAVLLIITALVDVRYAKRVTQREEAPNV